MLPHIVLLASIQLPVAVLGSVYDSGPIAAAKVKGCALGLPRFSLVEGALPQGVELSVAGYLRGRPETAGNYAAVIELDNGCATFRMPVTLPVRGKPLLMAEFDEFELTRESPTLVARVRSDWEGLAYRVATDVPGLIRVRPLRGRTGYAGEAQEADLVEITALDFPRESEPTAPREAQILFTCHRCVGTSVRVVLR